MADTKITALAALTAADPANDVLPIVDIDDHSMAASGTTKQISINNILGASGTATLASATITGDLTVDTSTLKVDSALNKVGVGVATLTGLQTFNVAGDVGITSDLVLKNSGGTVQGYIFGSSGINYRVIAGQPHVWQEGGSDLMRLNSTGLGVGASPNQKFVCAGPRAYFAGGGAVYGIGIGFNTTRTAADQVFFLGATDSATPDLVFSGASGAPLMRLDATGNVGVGVTPSYRLQSAVASGADGNIFAAQVLGASNGFQVLWNHATTTTRVIIANIPTSSAGLAAGTLWNDAGTIKIA